MSKPALILVDVINSFFTEGMPNYYPAALEVLEPLQALLAAAAARGRDRRPCRRAPLSRLRRLRMAEAAATPFRRRAPTRRSSPDFAPQGAREIFVAKRRYSAFFATDLALFLHEQKVDARRSSPASRPMSASARRRRTPSPTASTSSCRARRPTRTGRIWPQPRSRTSTATSVAWFLSPTRIRMLE